MQWVNKPEAKELFKFLNPFLKLPDHRSLSEKILKNTISKGNKVIEITLKEDQIGIIFTFDG